MLNENEILILDKKGKDVTSKVTEISAFQVTIQYSADRIYTYNKSNLKIITSPIDLNDCLIVTSSKKLTNISKVLKFDNYIKAFFNNGSNKVYKQSEVTIEQNLLNQELFRNVFNYIREMANHITISDITQNQEKEIDNDNFLKK